MIRKKLSQFMLEYFKDESSRPSRPTLIAHIRDGILSGEQIGAMWYVKCTEWGEPLYYGNKQDCQTPPPSLTTGNALADRILSTHR